MNLPDYSWCPGCGLILGCVIGALLWIAGIAVTLWLWERMV